MNLKSIENIFFNIYEYIHIKWKKTYCSQTFTNEIKYTLNTWIIKWLKYIYKVTIWNNAFVFT